MEKAQQRNRKSPGDRAVVVGGKGIDILCKQKMPDFVLRKREDRHDDPTEEGDYILTN